MAAHHTPRRQYGLPRRAVLLLLGVTALFRSSLALAAEDLPPPSLRFERISVAEGLSFSLSTSILQDQRGFMWFGTRYGLNKYDAFSFTIYLLESRDDLLFGNYVEDLYQDRSGALWVSTHAGLVRMDVWTGEFIHYKHDAGSPQEPGAGPDMGDRRGLRRGVVDWDEPGIEPL